MRFMKLCLFILFGCIMFNCVAGDEKNGFPAKTWAKLVPNRILDFDGVSHRYLSQPVLGPGLHPAVILLHDSTQTADQVWKEISLATLGRANGFVVVAPDATKNRHWNDGRNALSGKRDVLSDADDLGYLKKLIEEIVQADNVDPNAIFLAGVANGGVMAMRFACESGISLRAVAVINAELPESLASGCHVGKPLPWISLNGDQDPLVPFDGLKSETEIEGNLQPAAKSADQTFSFFADNAQCAKDVLAQTLPHISQSDDSTAERRTRSACAGGTTSTQYVFHKAGHTIPAESLAPAAIKSKGGLNQDVDAGTIIWEHFRQTLTT